MKNIYKILFASLILGTAACTDLDLEPTDPNTLDAETFFTTPEAFEESLAKLYGGLYLTGQQSTAGLGDISDIDEGESSYLRTFYLHQELSTDEAIIGFNDKTIQDFHNHQWGASDDFIRAMFARFYYQITAANAFIAEANASTVEGTELYAAEARFLRALSYWHALDLFRNLPFVTDEDEIGAFLPEQATPETVFNFIESELLAIEDVLTSPTDRMHYPRATQGAGQMLLAKLYLNAQIYVGVDRSADCLEYTNRVIQQSAYSLDPSYDNLFLADNQDSPEIIFAIAHDGANGGQFGGLNFIANSAIGGSMDNAAFGLPNGGWGGTRTTSAFVDLFVDDLAALNDGSFNEENATDSRANFHVDGQNKEIVEVGTFTDGFAITKWKNITSDGNTGSDGEFVDIDFPLFRLADAYLMYAELAVRSVPGADLNTALGYINELRERAYGNSNGNIGQSNLNLEFILDERARELYWECHRRTDLVRFGLFTGGGYIWPWKGGVPNGVSTGSFRDIYPIPSADLTSNPNLDQNDGY